MTIGNWNVWWSRNLKASQSARTRKKITAILKSLLKILIWPYFGPQKTFVLQNFDFEPELGLVFGIKRHFGDFGFWHKNKFFFLQKSTENSKLTFFSFRKFRGQSGGALRQNKDVPLGRVLFSTSGNNLWQGFEITKLQKMDLTRSSFCHF